MLELTTKQQKLLDELLKDFDGDAQALLGREGLLGAISKRAIETDAGSLDLEVPRDRNGSFEPQIVKKRQRRMGGLDEALIHLYARGQSTRSIQETIKELYGADVSSSLVSDVTASVLEDVLAWQSRPLEKVYAIAYFDALFVKSREEGTVKTRAVYAGLAIDLEGEKQVLGLWMAPTETECLRTLNQTYTVDWTPLIGLFRSCQIKYFQ